MKRNIFRIVAASYIFILSFVQALAPLAARADSGGGIEIAPVLVEVSATPGQTITTSIRLRNVAKIPFFLTPHMDDFTAKGEDGEPMVLGDSETAPSYSMKSWIVSPGDIELVPNVYKTVAVTINVPKDAEPGGHYGVIRFASDQAKGKNNTGVSLTASVGTLLLVKVSGKINESLEYLTFHAGSGSGATHFFQKSPITFTQRVRNNGNIHEKITGQLVILDSSGKKVAGLNINEKRGNILPSSVRAFSETWKTNAIFGHFTATAHLAYASGKTLESPIISFWIIPYKLIGFGILGLILLYGLLRILGSRYRFSVSKASKGR